MHCHECARTNLVVPALGLCRLCLVALCKNHLVSATADRGALLFSCLHGADRPFASPQPPQGRLAPAVEPVR